MAKKKLFIATIKIALNADACCNSDEGASDYFSEMLSQNKDVFDWVYVTPSKIIEIKDGKYKEGNLFNGLTSIKYL